MRLTPQDWRWYSASSPGGSLSQIGVHQFDTLRYLGGDIAAVSASAARHSPAGAEVEDQWIVAVHFADGKLGTVISSWTSPGTFNVRATGLDALMVYDIDQTHWADPERLHENATLYMQARGKGPADRQALPVPDGNMYRDELDLFADSVAIRRGMRTVGRQWLPSGGGGLRRAQIGRGGQPRGAFERNHRTGAGAIGGRDGHAARRRRPAIGGSR